MSENKGLYGDSLHPYSEPEPEEVTLHPAEINLIRYIRTLKYGSLTIKVQHGLPEVGEEVRASVKFNRKGGR